VFWVHASTQARFEEAYRDIADRLNLPERHNPKEDVLGLVHKWLRDETNGQWTMVLDNVDNVETFFPPRKRQRDEPDQIMPKSLATYLPQSRNGSILITSRSKDAADRLVGGRNNVKEVLAMGQGQGVQLLRNKLQDTLGDEGTVELVQALDYMPLAITQAAAYINRQTRMTIPKYLSDFRASDKKRESLLNWDAGDLRRDESASNSVVTTWQMSFERIQQERPSAADLLSLMSYFNPQGIPEKILQSYSSTTARTRALDNKVEADSSFEEDINTLHAYCLISITMDDGTCGMHALVQFCTRLWLSASGTLQHWEREFVVLLVREFPRADFENWKTCQQLLPHIYSLYETGLSDYGLIWSWAAMLNHAARYIQTAQGKYEEAEKLNRRALEGCEKELGAHHLGTLGSLHNLALVLQSQGKYEESEKLNRRALDGYEKDLGVHHPQTFTSVNNLALVLQSQEKYDEAEKLIRRALEGREKELGVHHPDTLTSVENLAGMLQSQGKYEEAEKLNRRALEGMEKELGVHHPDTLTSVENLAGMLQSQGKYEEAEKLIRRALEGMEKELGVHHPDTLASVNNLALVLQIQGKYDEAEKLNRRALEGYEKDLGVHHPDTLTSVNHLALVLQSQGKYDEAEKLNRRALEGYEKELSVHHPDTLTSVNHLALVLQSQGKYGEAEKFNQRALEGYEKELGVHHPHTLTSVNHLALVLQSQGKYDEAEKLNRRALEGREKELGLHHPDTLASVNSREVQPASDGREGEGTKGTPPTHTHLCLLSCLSFTQTGAVQ
jgi:tetratricopeptide (TPR) repeat protein